MATQEGARIVKTPEVLGGKPRIEGRRIGVCFINERVEGAGLDPHDVADQHDLDVADVYRALAYYYEHPDEMAAIADRRSAIEAEIAAEPHVATRPEDSG